MPGISRLNPVTSTKAVANTSRGTGLAADQNPIYDAMGNFAGYESSTESAPPKANAAKKGSTTKTFTGLIETLNKLEQEQVQKGLFEKANIYELEFLPKDLENSKVTLPGKLKSKTPMQNGQTASDQIDPDKQSMDTTVRTFGFQAGTPIVQIIDQIMRNSSYITDQAIVAVDEEEQTNTEQKPLGQLAWYKINMEATPIGIDNKRKDSVYKIKFVITTYGINRMVSEYFPEGRYRGSHKSYNYWFTGQNTQVLNFEQDFNSLWAVALTNPNLVQKFKQQTNNREMYSTVYQAASEQSSQGAQGRTNEAGASGADYLYSPTDQANIKLKLVGDPAWLQQGEISSGVSASTFTFKPFNNDGTINFDASEIAFDINWNRPVDYDLNGTGLMNTTAGNYNKSATSAGQPTESARYKAVTCKSTFRQGKFEQELVGSLLMVPVATTSKATSETTRQGATNNLLNANSGTRVANQQIDNPAYGDQEGDYEQYPGQDSPTLGDQEGDYDQYAIPNPEPVDPSLEATDGYNQQLVENAVAEEALIGEVGTATTVGTETPKIGRVTLDTITNEDPQLMSKIGRAHV